MVPLTIINSMTFSHLPSVFKKEKFNSLLNKILTKKILMTLILLRDITIAKINLILMIDDKFKKKLINLTLIIIM